MSHDSKVATCSLLVAPVAVARRNQAQVLVSKACLDGLTLDADPLAGGGADGVRAEDGMRGHAAQLLAVVAPAQLPRQVLADAVQLVLGVLEDLGRGHAFRHLVVTCAGETDHDH